MKKDGPNKGREFYKCPKQPACNFFEWADASGLNTSYGGPRGGGASTSGNNFQNPPRNYGNNAANQGQGRYYLVWTLLQPNQIVRNTLFFYFTFFSFFMF